MNKKVALGKGAIDSCDYLTLATCPCCHWRREGRTKGHAWYLLARHLKEVHREEQAFRLAERNAHRLGYSVKRR